jgi:OOP family OmpA-OmpF porin
MSSKAIAIVVALLSVPTGCSSEGAGETVQEPPEAADPGPPAVLTLTRSSDSIHLRGSVPGPTERDRVLSSVQRRFATSTITDSITVDEVSEPPWQDLLGPVLDLTLELLPSVDLTFQGRTIIVAGVTDQENRRAELNERIRATAPDFQVQFRVRLISPGSSEVEQGLERILAGRRIEFEHVSPSLTASSEPILDDIAELLRRYPEVRIRIVGHMNGLPEDPTVSRISRLRAQEVGLRLMERGVSENRIRAVGVGGSEPLAPLASPEGRVLNNRIEFFVLRGN